jgi:hypothetical protein
MALRVTGLPMKWLFVLATGLVAWFSFTNALGEIAAKSAPAFVLRFAPNTMIAQAALAEADLMAGPKSLTFKDVAPLARAALQGQAINVRALRVLGFALDAAVKPDQARSLMQLAGQLTRRDLGTQLWLVEDAVKEDNVEQALTHHDLALRTNYEASPILFPVLANALSDEVLQHSFGRFIKANPPWLAEFLNFAITDGANLTGLLNMIRFAHGLPQGTTYRAIDSRLIGRLAEKNMLSETRQFYAMMAGSNRQTPVSATFDAQNTDVRFAPVTWQLLPTPGTEVQFAKAERGDGLQLHVIADAGERGVIAQKLLFLPPGRYHLTNGVRFIQGGSGTQVYFAAVCKSQVAAPEIWRQVIADDGRPANTSVDLVVGADCPVQQLLITVAAGPDQSGTEFVIDQVSLK